MTFITKILSTDKAIKTLGIYFILLDKKEVSRADLTAITGINAVSISQYVSSFLKAGFIFEKEIGESSGGRPPVILQLNESIFCMGMHILVDQVRIVVSTSSLHKVYEAQFSYNQSENIVPSIIDKLKNEVLDKYPLASVCFASDKEYFQDQESLEKFFTQMDIPIYTSSAAEAGAYISSFQLLNRDQTKKILYVYEDLGDCVLLHNNNLYSADEDKNFYFRPWTKSLGILENTKKVFDGQSEQLNYEQIYDACVKGDNSLSDVIHFVALNLGVRIAFLINLTKVDTIFLGEEISVLKEYFIDPIKEFVFKMVKKTHKDKISIEYIEKEKFPVVYGLAGLAIRQLFIGG